MVLLCTQTLIPAHGKQVLVKGELSECSLGASLAEGKT